MQPDANVRRNMIVLTAAQAVGAASPPIIISLGGIVGQTLSSTPALATLPVSLYNLGLALGTLPAAAIMRKYGRRSGYLLGASIGLISALVAALGIVSATFVVFCLGTFLAGFYGAYVQSYRFAAADGVSGSAKSRAIAWVMVGGLFAAIIGPQLVIWTRDAIPGVPFAGSFLSQAVLALLALPIVAMLRAPAPASLHAASAPAKPIGEILRLPGFLLAICTGIVSFGLMSFVMTASPIAMVGCGFTVGEAAFGIQWHVLSMFAPSFFTGYLITRFGREKIAALGLLLLALSGAVALSGLALHNFYLALILLGIGWNFGFIGATSMVADCVSAADRTRAQGLNDFLVFGSVATASFFSGTLLTTAGWSTINWIIFPVVALILIPLLLRIGKTRQAGNLKA